jgi:hypothetical protein
MTSLDEFDNITAPYLMNHGQKFYLDIFNMHFPLPFYFAYIISALWVDGSPSRAISIFRLSLLLVYFSSYFSVFYSFKNIKSKISFCLWIVLMGILIPLYHGNLYLSETFTTIFISSIFWLSLPIVLKWENFNYYHLWLLIIFASLAFWTQPLLIYLFLIPLFFIKKSQFWRFVMISLILNILPLIYFSLNGQLLDFINQAILFNLKTYSHFFPEQIKNYSMSFQSFLNFFTNELYLLTHFNSTTQIYQFISHLSFIILFIFLIKEKKLKNILVLLLIFFNTRLRETKVIPGQIFNFAFFPFLSISTASTLLLIFNFKNIKSKIIFSFLSLIIFITVIIDFAPIFKQSIVQGYNYEVFWSYRQRIGEDIARFTKPDEKILVYPYDSDLYFFSKREPSDKFLYWYPWVNSVADYKSERLKSFQQNPPALIYYGNMSYKNDPQAYAQFFPNLLDNYINIFKEGKPTHYWIRQDLKNRLD